MEGAKSLVSSMHDSYFVILQLTTHLFRGGAPFLLFVRYSHQQPVSILFLLDLTESFVEVSRFPGGSSVIHIYRGIFTDCHITRNGRDKLPR